MRFTLPTNPRRAHGFTLIEVLVISPILILTIGGFVYTLTTIVSDALAIRDTNTMIYDTQTALDRIEQDARLSIQFPASTSSLPSPQGSDSNFTGTAGFTAGSNVLIMSTLSTTSNPLDPARQVVYFASPNACGTSQVYNAPLITTVVYYVNNGSLYRRTIVPTWTTTAGANQVCASNVWQQNSCSPGYTNTTQCQTTDAKLMDNVQSFTTAYYGSAGSTTDLGAANAATATTIGATIVGNKTTAGQTVTNTATMRASKINNN